MRKEMELTFHRGVPATDNLTPKYSFSILAITRHTLKALLGEWRNRREAWMISWEYHIPWGDKQIFIHNDENIRFQYAW